MAVPPSSWMIAAVSSIVSGRPYGDGLPLTLRPVQYTVAPASPRAQAIPRPAPRVAPATRAIRPWSGFMAPDVTHNGRTRSTRKREPIAFSYRASRKPELHVPHRGGHH